MQDIKKVFDDYYEAVYDTDRNRALKRVDLALIEGILPEDIVFKVVIPSIQKLITDLVDGHRANLSQHYICSQVSGEVVELLLPLFKSGGERKGTIILGTSRGDFHGLGKKIVGGCLSANIPTCQIKCHLSSEILYLS
ncbi:MAG: hypothetical protein JEY99_21410 [Spirochaetales bacterium]|nr:hypothetical protein [Spirochaetales bacterium]